MPEGKKRVVLGLITSKTGELEDRDMIRRRIEEATKYVALDQCFRLSTQCGFASTEDGNVLSEAQQWSKLREVVAIAGEVWGSASARPVGAVAEVADGRYEASATPRLRLAAVCELMRRDSRNVDNRSRNEASSFLLKQPNNSASNWSICRSHSGSNRFPSLLSTTRRMRRFSGASWRLINPLRCNAAMTSFMD